MSPELLFFVLCCLLRCSQGEDSATPVLKCSYKGPLNCPESGNITSVLNSTEFAIVAEETRKVLNQVSAFGARLFRFQVTPSTQQTVKLIGRQFEQINHSLQSLHLSLKCQIHMSFFDDIVARTSVISMLIAENVVNPSCDNARCLATSCHGTDYGRKFLLPLRNTIENMNSFPYVCLRDEQFTYKIYKSLNLKIAQMFFMLDIATQQCIAYRDSQSIPGQEFEKIVRDFADFHENFRVYQLQNELRAIADFTKSSIQSRDSCQQTMETVRDHIHNEYNRFSFRFPVMCETYGAYSSVMVGAYVQDDSVAVVADVEQKTVTIARIPLDNPYTVPTVSAIFRNLDKINAILTNPASVRLNAREIADQLLKVVPNPPILRVSRFGAWSDPVESAVDRDKGMMFSEGSGHFVGGRRVRTVVFFGY